MEKILITTSSFSANDPAPLKKLEALNCEVVLNPLKRKLTEKEARELIKEYQPDALLAGVEPLTREVLSAAEKLKIISRCGIGLDSVDLRAASELNIKVVNTPDAPTVAVAELTLGLILSLLRRIYLSHLSIRKGEWERPMGKLLYQKTVGIVGCGRIGICLAKMLKSFNCTVLGTDPACAHNNEIEMTELNLLLTNADIVSLHLPYNKQTHHFFNAEKIALMKKGAYLVNAARGGLIDEEALLQAIKKGHLAGAALDTYEKEPYSGPLKELDEVLLTAHIGSYAAEARVLMEMQAVENILENL